MWISMGGIIHHRQRRQRCGGLYTIYNQLDGWIALHCRSCSCCCRCWESGFVSFHPILRAAESFPDCFGVCCTASQLSVRRGTVDLADCVWVFFPPGICTYVLLFLRTRVAVFPTCFTSFASQKFNLAGLKCAELSHIISRC